MRCFDARSIKAAVPGVYITKRRKWMLKTKWTPGVARCFGLIYLREPRSGEAVYAGSIRCELERGHDGDCLFADDNYVYEWDGVER